MRVSCFSLLFDFLSHSLPLFCPLASHSFCAYSIFFFSHSSHRHNRFTSFLSLVSCGIHYYEVESIIQEKLTLSLSSDSDLIVITWIFQSTILIDFRNIMILNTYIYNYMYTIFHFYTEKNFWLKIDEPKNFNHINQNSSYLHSLRKNVSIKF